jgi:hypothetical protein
VKYDETNNFHVEVNNTEITVIMNHSTNSHWLSNDDQSALILPATGRQSYLTVVLS